VGKYGERHGSPEKLMKLTKASVLSKQLYVLQTVLSITIQF